MHRPFDTRDDSQLIPKIVEDQIDQNIPEVQPENPPGRSRIVDTEEKLLNYIKRQLGQPMISIEVPDESILDIIYETVMKFTEYSWEGELERALLVEAKGQGQYQFKLPVREVLSVHSTNTGQMNYGQNYGQGYVPDMWIDMTNNMQDIMVSMISISNMTQMSEKYFQLEPNWSFSQGRNQLHLHENYSGQLLINYIELYEPLQEDMIYNHPWVKEYQIQRTKFLWGTITGKYSQSLVGGQQINYSDMKSEAENEMQRLHEELLTKYTDPQPIDVQ